mmetsp:Transcript_7450/g.10979  ORF Transcript_7450/g.10979 Transcript_7450/m.10979 type:complete len:201 (+) Transcript_7450:493-1095(+)
MVLFQNGLSVQDVLVILVLPSEVAVDDLPQGAVGVVHVHPHLPLQVQGHQGVGGPDDVRELVVGDVLVDLAEHGQDDLRQGDCKLDARDPARVPSCSRLEVAVREREERHELVVGPRVELGQLRDQPLVVSRPRRQQNQVGDGLWGHLGRDDDLCNHSSVGVYVPASEAGELLGGDGRLRESGQAEERVDSVVVHEGELS